MTPPNLSKYAVKSVPRYTSYPTVPHFTEAVGAADYADWLAQLDVSEPVSLYLHVPFCKQLCWYCGCNMKLAKRADPVTQYARMLMREIRLIARLLPARMTISHLHWGGGTPTALAPDELERAMEVVREHFDFAAGAELAIESDPRTLSNEMIDRIGRLGFTRASFGVQEFNPKVQAAINRVQPPEMVRRAVEGLRGAGVRGLNFDLIFGLPHQSVETLIETVRLCAGLQPDRIALFGYAHVPWMARKQRLIDAAALPGAGERLAQNAAAAEALQQAGYVAVGLDHFALPQDPLALAAANGVLRRNFQGYTTDNAAALLGVGASSIGRTPGGYVQNFTETGAWARAVKAGTPPVAKGHALTSEDRLRAGVIEALMCQGEVDLDACGEAAGVCGGWHADAEEDLEALATDGVIARRGGLIALRPEAAALARVVAACFDGYLRRSEARHSTAV